MDTVWNLLSPIGVPTERPVGRRATDAGAERIIGFLSNRKPNASLLLKTLMGRLQERGYEARFYEKLNAATPAGEQIIARIAKECASVIVASGD